MKSKLVWLLPLAGFATVLTGCESHPHAHPLPASGPDRASWHDGRPGVGQDRRMPRKSYQTSWYSPAHL